MEFEIREYTLSDRKKLLTLTERLHDYVVEMDPLYRLRRMPGYAEHYLEETLLIVARQQGKILLAEVESTVIGHIIGVVGEKQTEENLLEVIPNKLGIILDLYVDQEYRGHAIGTKLIEKMESYLKSMGCDGLWVNVFGPNEKAQKFYKRHGFVTREVSLLKRI